MFWKKKKKRFNLYEDEIDYTDRIDEEADSDSSAEVNQDEDISDGVTEDAASYSGTGDDDLPRLKFELPGEEPAKDSDSGYEGSEPVQDSGYEETESVQDSGYEGSESVQDSDYEENGPVQEPEASVSDENKLPKMTFNSADGQSEADDADRGGKSVGIISRLFGRKLPKRKEVHSASEEQNALDRFQVEDEQKADDRSFTPDTRYADDASDTADPQQADGASVVAAPKDVDGASDTVDTQDVDDTPDTADTWYADGTSDTADTRYADGASDTADTRYADGASDTADTQYADDASDMEDAQYPDDMTDTEAAQYADDNPGSEDTGMESDAEAASDSDDILPPGLGVTRNRRQKEKKNIFKKIGKPSAVLDKIKKNGKVESQTAGMESSTPAGDDEFSDKKRPTKKIAIIAAAVVLILGVVIFFVIRNLRSATEGKVYVESVGEITGLNAANGMSNRYTGEVEAQDSWKISLQPGLTVAKCYVHVGDEVKKGDKLFSYNTEELKLNKEKKELEIETANNEIRQLKKDIEGYEKDIKSAKGSEKIELQTQLLTAQTTIKKDEFAIKSGQEELKQLKKNIKDATIKSKMAGVVKKINASVGAGSQGEEDDGAVEDTGDNVYMTILALGDYRVRGTVSESNVAELTEGAPVIIRSRVDNDKIWKGSISQVKTDTKADQEGTENAEAEADYSEYAGDTAAKYNFYVKLEDDTDLMMGQHVLVELDNGQEDKKEGIWLNSAYLHIEGDDFYVWAANGRDRLTLRKVTVGEYNEALDEYQILKGLSVKDYITTDAENLRENMRTTKNISESDSTEYYDEETNDDQLYDDEGSMPEDIDDEGLYEDVDNNVDDGGQGQIEEDNSDMGPEQLQQDEGDKL